MLHIFFNMPLSSLHIFLFIKSMLFLITHKYLNLMQQILIHRSYGVHAAIGMATTCKLSLHAELFSHPLFFKFSSSISVSSSLLSFSEHVFAEEKQTRAREIVLKA